MRPIYNTRYRHRLVAALAAGIGAGVISTVVQMMLWWIASMPVWEMLLRDSRLAAAIVMGPAVLPPPTSFDILIMVSATIVHFALSIAFGLLLAPFITRTGMTASLGIGMVFGLVLYAINMYGFTAIFPWFETSRDWITAAAHASFGITAAYLYKIWDRHMTALAQQ